MLTPIPEESKGVFFVFFLLELCLKYLGFILEHTNQGHNGVIYHLFTTELLLCHAPTVVQPGNSANTPSRRGAPIRAFIIPFCDLQNWFFTKISDTDNRWQLIDMKAHQINGKKKKNMFLSTEAKVYVGF